MVVDTNVVVSATLMPNSTPGQALDYLMESRALLSSPDTFSELVEVLWRARFDRYIQEGDRLNFLIFLRQNAELIEVTHSVTACRDPKDDKFLELALSGRATHIVTGDRDLLDLHPFRGIPILTPGAFLSAAG